jgi:hypothetical protein
MATALLDISSVLESYELDESDIRLLSKKNFESEGK